ncbi:phage baseplate assembly protein V [Lachnospiraceae bacterium C1.1]|nr:phage baseplate assembly protein V [Lachnospiraceae bacterium C1.1]
MAFDFYENELSQFDDIERRSKRLGLTLAKVTNIKDPENKNRVLCKPVTGEKEKDILEMEWADVIQPLSGKNAGTFLLPSVDDVVLIAYLDGDPHCPYVVGGVWDKKSTAPYKMKDGKNNDFSFKTPGGSELHFSDQKDKQKITLSTPKGTEICLDDENEKLTVTDKKKKNTITINIKKGEIEIKAEKKLTLAAGDTSLVMESSGKATLKGKGAVSIEGSSIKENAKSSMEIKGASTKVEASGKLTLKGSMADLKGPAGVNIN